MKKIAFYWNQFFFAPISPATIGLFRIGFGLVILDSLIGKFPDREFLYGMNGLITPATIMSYFQGAELRFNALHLVPGSDPQLMWFFIGVLAAALCLTAGLFTRLSSIAVFLGLLALSNRNFLADNSGDDIIRVFSFFLMFAPAGAAFSLDRWWRVKKGLEKGELALRSPWAQRLLQLQFAYVYLDSVFLKAHGAAWLDGTALYYALNYVELKRFDFNWFFYYLWQVKVATWAVLGVEASMCTLVWFRRFRYPCLLAALILHLGINLVMQFPVFEYAMISGLVLFIETGPGQESGPKR